MHSRSSGLMEPLEKPWPYKSWGYRWDPIVFLLSLFVFVLPRIICWTLYTFSYPLSLIDGTTKRFKDNSKLVVVEGPPALDKTKFAKGCLLFSLLRGRVGVTLGSKSRKWVNFSLLRAC